MYNKKKIENLISISFSFPNTLYNLGLQGEITILTERHPKIVFWLKGWNHE
jgi:hypothetical protein